MTAFWRLGLFKQLSNPRMETNPHCIKVYRLGTGYNLDETGQPLMGWEYIVDFTPDNPTGAFFMDEGDHRNFEGRFVDAALLLEPLWLDLLVKTGALWLIPLLERMANGEVVTTDEVLEAYEAVYGAPPHVAEWKLDAN